MISRHYLITAATGIRKSEQVAALDRPGEIAERAIDKFHRQAVSADGRDSFTAQWVIPGEDRVDMQTTVGDARNNLLHDRGGSNRFVAAVGCNTFAPSKSAEQYFDVLIDFPKQVSADAPGVIIPVVILTRGRGYEGLSSYGVRDVSIRVDIVDDVIPTVIHTRDTHTHIIRKWPANCAFYANLAFFADKNVGKTIQHIGRFTGNILNQSARGVSTKQGALRAPQNFDALQIEHAKPVSLNRGHVPFIHVYRIRGLDGVVKISLDNTAYGKLCVLTTTGRGDVDARSKTRNLVTLLQTQAPDVIT